MSTIGSQGIDANGQPKAISLSKLPRALIGRRWWWTTLLVVAGMIVLARLGVWQLDRLQQRRARNAEYLQQISAPPLLLAGEDLPADPVELRDRQANAKGSYDFSEQLILVQQNWQGRPGAHLVTPLLLEGGNVAILVDRGWIPSADVEAGNLDQFDEPGPQMVTGALQLSQTLSGGRETIVEGKQKEWYRVDIEAIQNQMPYSLMPLYLLASPADETIDSMPYRIENEVDLSEGSHLVYAIQWFSFALILGAGYLYYVKSHP